MLFLKIFAWLLLFEYKLNKLGKNMPRTSTNQSIASSNSSSTIASSYSSHSSSSSSAAQNSYSATSPSSISSSSSSSSTSGHHVPLSSSSPRSSRHQSPNSISNVVIASAQPFYINGGGNGAHPPTSMTTISPSGLLTDGPLGRRTATTNRV